MTTAVVEVERVLTEDGQPPVLGDRRLAVVGVHEFDHRTPEQLVARVTERLFPGAVDRREDSPSKSAVAIRSSERFRCGASSPSSFRLRSTNEPTSPPTMNTAVARVQ